MNDWNNVVPVYYKIYSSIVEHSCGWMIDYGYNYWSTNPFFTGHIDAPLSCLSISDASYNGDPSSIVGIDIGTSSAFTDILFYDVVNHERFGDMINLHHLDIGAYQHYSNNTYYFQPQSMPLPQRYRDDSTEVIDNENMYNILGQPVDDTYHGIVIRNGKKVIKK